LHSPLLFINSTGSQIRDSAARSVLTPGCAAYTTVCATGQLFFATMKFSPKYMFRFETAGESHGECLVATLTGLPAGIPISPDTINRELWRRQQGYGRGGRMKLETDQVQIVAGVRHSRTIGSPIAILIQNKDWKNWTEALPVEDIAGAEDKRKPVTRPRPGHADLAGSIKYNFHDARYVLERASARETTARVAVGGVAKAFLGQFGISVLSHVIGVGHIRLARLAAWDELVALSEKSEVLLGCVDPDTEKQMKEVVDQAYRIGDTVGGVFEVVAHNVPPGLGSHITWDSRLDGRLAQAIVSMQAVKGVEIGLAAEGAASFGSHVQDTIQYQKEERRFTRGANRAGGLEGGMTNGQDVLVRGLLKPISTLRKPLESVDFATREPALAAYERSDVAVVPAAGVIGEAMVAIVLAQAFLEKFGGDSIEETRRNFEGYKEQVKNF
jgi:chorismate synthase